MFCTIKSYFTFLTFVSLSFRPSSPTVSRSTIRLLTYVCHDCPVCEFPKESENSYHTKHLVCVWVCVRCKDDGTDWWIVINDSYPGRVPIGTDFLTSHHLSEDSKVGFLFLIYPFVLYGKNFEVSWQTRSSFNQRHPNSSLL